MRARHLLALPLGASLVAATSLPEHRVAQLRLSDQAQRPFVEGELVVAFHDSVPDAMSARTIRDAGGRSARRSAHGNRFLVALEPGLSEADAVVRLLAQPEVRYAERNGVVRAHFEPNDPSFDLQWHLPHLGAQRTWDIQQCADDVVVAVLDTGVAYEDFGPFRKAPDWGDVRFVEGYNIYTRDSHANDDNFHGTHVASIVAQGTDNGLGGAGFAFGCGLMPVKVLDASGVGGFFGVAEGIDHAVAFVDGSGANPVKVINMSLGGDNDSRSVAEAVARALEAGIVLVASAGNDGIQGVAYPARDPNVIAVGAVDVRNRRAPYSNSGSEIDVVAPGGDLARDDNGDGRPDGILQQTFDPRTARLEGRYDDFALFFVVGTSQAAPQVAALAALLVAQGISDPVAVRRAIESTALDLGDPGRDDVFGHGLIQPAQALTGLGLNQ